MANTLYRHVTRSTAHKHDVVDELTEKFRRATSTLITDYRGLSVKELENLRAQLRDRQIDYVVAKNTLARRAAVNADLSALSEGLSGPAGLVIGYDDVAAPAKVVTDFMRTTRTLALSGGVVEGQYLNEAGVKEIANLPSRDVLLGQLAGTLLSPLSQLAGSLDSVLSNFAATVDAYREHRETQS